jgi:hypothetical protein
VPIYRCDAEGHVFRLSLARRLFAVHLGLKKYARCPVDGRWGMIRFVPRDQLTDSELARVERDRW